MAIDILKKYKACESAMTFCSGKDLMTAWNECDRGDWMAWYYCNIKGFDDKAEKVKNECLKMSPPDVQYTTGNGKQFAGALIDIAKRIAVNEGIKVELTLERFAIICRKHLTQSMFS